MSSTPHTIYNLTLLVASSVLASHCGAPLTLFMLIGVIKKKLFSVIASRVLTRKIS